MSAPKITPKDLLKARRPQRFSDSIVQEIPELHTSTLEYHLDTLTNREQSREFEDFARRLTQKTICPNLLPQTGPTGGGDSKVDSETFPVAESIAFAWSFGEPRKASDERWAFAFSAKADWQPKLKSDIAKLVATNREYKKAFFVTNQFVRDKVRGEVEDELSKKHGIDVRILDRSWIVEQVFEKGHIDIAIDELDLCPNLRPMIKVGPLDYRKMQALEDLEQRIKFACEDGSQSFAFVDECLEAAKITASLERPRTEVDGTFARAQRAAEEFGSVRQKIRIAYQRAWTAYWWYEDYAVFNEMYSSLQSLVCGGRNVYDFELLHNLWQLKFAFAQSGAFSVAPDEMSMQTKFLVGELERLGADEERPSTAYHADGLRLMMQMFQHVNGDPKPAFEEMKELIESCAGLAGFPFDSFAEVLNELGKLMATADGFAELFECLVTAMKERRGEVASATLLIERAFQLLNSNEPVEAIRMIGRSLVDLYKHESRPELTKALYLMAMAYRHLGLRYAARGSMLSAASIATNHFWERDQVIPPQAACYNRIKWLECEMGRIPQALDWHRSELAIRSVLQAAGNENLSSPTDASRFDILLAFHFLRTDLWQLNRLTKLPSSLAELSLFYSSLSLRYALGDVEEVQTELVRLLGPEALAEQFFLDICKQSGELDYPEQPSYSDGQSVLLHSTILGCKIIAQTTNNLHCLTLAESVLAAFESFFATGFVDGVFAHEPRLLLDIREGIFTDKVFDFKFDESSLDPKVTIRCDTNKLSATEAETQTQIQEQIFALMANLLERVFSPKDLDGTLKKWFADDKVLHRALNFSTSFVTIRNILGDSPRTDISDWINNGSKEYPLNRSVNWDSSFLELKNDSDSGNQESTMNPGIGDPPKGMLDQIGRTPHSNLKTISIIRETLWTRAGWSGTMFVADETFEFPLFLAFVFKNDQMGKEIFADWTRRFGKADTDNTIKVSVITGIEASNPFAYRVAVGTSDFQAAGQDGYVFLKSRVNTMTPLNHDNLKRFVRCFEKAKAFGLTFAVDDDSGEMPIPNYSAAIEKSHFSVTEAWRIGRNDPLLMAIQPDDNIIVPPNQPNAPIIEALAFLNRAQIVNESHLAKESVAKLRKRRKELKRTMENRKKKT